MARRDKLAAEMAVIAAEAAAEAAHATAAAARAALASASLAEQSAVRTATAARLVVEATRADLDDATSDAALADVGEPEAHHWHLRGAEARSWHDRGRFLTADEQRRVLEHFPGDPDDVSPTSSDVSTKSGTRARSPWARCAFQ